jgi:predicted MFS family arabinose efflux permease
LAGAAHATWRAVLADRRRRLLVAVTALSFGAFGIILVADLPLVDHLGGGSVGYALLTTLWGIGAVGGSWAVARLPQRMETRALVLGTTAMAVSVTSLTVLPNLTTVIVVGAIGGLGSGIVFPPWFSLLQRSASDAERGTTFALAETFEQTSFLAGMTIAGGMVGWVGPRATYLLPGALLLAAAATARRLEHTA